MMRKVKAQAFPDFMDALRAYYLRPEKPPFAICYRHVLWLAQDRGWPCPSKSTARRLLAPGDAATSATL